MSVIYKKNAVPHKCTSSDNNTIVIDNADHVIKAGFGGDRTPIVQFPTVVGEPR